MKEMPLGALLVDAARLYRIRTDRALDAAGLGLTAGEARTLFYVRLYPERRQSALAVKMNIEPMTLVGFLDRLEALDLVAREPDPTDRRAKIVRLTAKAAPYLERMDVAAASARGDALAGLSDDEVAVFRKCLAHLRDNLADVLRCSEARAQERP